MTFVPEVFFRSPGVDSGAVEPGAGENSSEQVAPVACGQPPSTPFAENEKVRLNKILEFTYYLLIIMILAIRLAIG